MSKAAILAKKKRKEALATRGAELNAEKWERMRAQLARFEEYLQRFAMEHRGSIQRDPEFRAQFHRMCATLGVDPLTSRKGLWAELLGVGDYYYELGVSAIEECVRTRPLNAGVMRLGELVRVLRLRRSHYVDQVSTDDVERAVAKLAALGGGFRVVGSGKAKVVMSVPMELSLDHTQVLAVCGDKGFTTPSELRSATGWDRKRVNEALNYLLQAEVAWIDEQRKEAAYWVLGLLQG